jgi:hypothetical protein
LEQVDVEKLIGELEIAVDRLRSLYDQYFLGIEKLEPGVPRKDVDRRIHAIRKEQIRNTALRFRFQVVLQRYNTYQTHWQRICREIENGTYKRHLVRAQRRFGSSRPAPRRSVPPPALDPGKEANLPRDLAVQAAGIDEDFAQAMGIDIEIEQEPLVARPPPPPAKGGPPPVLADRTAPAVPRPAPPVWKKVAPAPAPAVERPAAQVPRPLVPPRPGPPAPPAAASTPTGGGDLPDERLRALYAEYVGAKRRQNESTAAITYQAVAKSLRESGDKLRKKHGKPVDFEVVVKDGKAVLRPVLK